MRGYEKALGPDHTSTLNTVHFLGNYYRDSGDFTQAEALYSKTLQAFEKLAHPARFLVTYNIGILRKREGKRSKAIVLLKAALDGLKSSFGPNSKFTLNAQDALTSLQDQDQVQVTESSEAVINFVEGEASIEPSISFSVAESIF